MDLKYKIEFAKSIFSQVAATAESRVAFGLLDRERIKSSLRRGESPSGYRVEWLKKSAKRVHAQLQDASQEFNEANRHDRVTDEDFIDVLEMALHLFRSTKKS